MRRSRQAAIAIAIVVGIVSCRQVADIPDVAPPPRCAAPTSAGPECGACLVAGCCVELEACDGDAACRVLLSCREACADSECRRACAEHATDESAFRVLACEARTCGSACGPACGDLRAPLGSCKPCAAPCCGAATAFAGDVAGWRLRGCRAACDTGDVRCGEVCSQEHALGASLEQSVRECVSRACGVEGDWSCIGRALPARAAEPSVISIDVLAFDAETLRFLPDARVRGCAPNDLECQDARFGETKTGGRGRAIIQVPLTPANGFDAYAGPIELTLPGYVPHLLFIAPAASSGAFVRAPLFRTELLDSVAKRGGVELAADRGSLVFVATDCRRASAAGLSFQSSTADERARGFYLLPASGGTQTVDFAAASTSAVGAGGILNIRAGLATLTATLDPLCLEAAKTTVSVRPGAVTSVDLSVSP